MLRLSAQYFRPSLTLKDKDLVGLSKRRIEDPSSTEFRRA